MHSIKREILVNILKNTAESYDVEVEDVSRDAKVPRELARMVLRKFNEEGIINLKANDKISVNSQQRLKIAEKAVLLGADIERVTRFLTWLEFENFSKSAFEASGFKVKKNFRFTWLRKRWEIDILGLKKPLVISADCKHWHKRWSGSASIRAAKNQIERTKALAEASKNLMNRIGVNGWKHAYFIPVVLSLSMPRYKFYKRTPIVSILQLKDFLEKVIVHLDEITSFHVSYVSLNEFINEGCRYVDEN